MTSSTPHATTELGHDDEARGQEREDFPTGMLASPTRTRL
jgi:hypothetical protein